LAHSAQAGACIRAGACVEVDVADPNRGCGFDTWERLSIRSAVDRAVMMALEAE
jgi:hypothetical protein